MTTLKVIKNRIKSVSNTKKITQSMKIVSTSKFVRAEQELENARSLGKGQKIFYEEIGVNLPVEIGSQLIVALTSDNGLCGAIHSGIARVINSSLVNNLSLASKSRLVCVGQYSVSIFSKTLPEKLIWTAKDVGKKNINFLDASVIAMKINECNTKSNYTVTKVHYNQCLSRMSYKVDVTDLYNKTAVYAGRNFAIYDEIEQEILESYLEFSYVVLIYWMMKEGACSELAARIVAMENATKNATKISEALKREFNRTRQTAITNELIDIISGANAVAK